MFCPFDCHAIQEAVSQSHIMDVLSNYTSIHCEVETNIPDAIFSQLVQAHAVRHILDCACGKLDVLQYKVQLMMSHFADIKAKMAFGKVCTK